jgi:hypothetical protein
LKHGRKIHRTPNPIIIPAAAGEAQWICEVNPVHPNLDEAGQQTVIGKEIF